MKRFLPWIAFWGLAALFYVLYAGRGGASMAQIARLAIPLLLVAMATEITLGGILLPRYLLRGDRRRFLLYGTYTLVVSIWLVLGTIVFEFMAAGLDVSGMSPASLDRPGLLAGVYVVVVAALCVRLVGHWENVRQQLDTATQTQAPLEITVDRKTVRLKPADISYLESAGDYVLVNTASGQLMTKARLGHLAEEWAEAGFLRVHRSFVVRTAAVDAVTASEVTVGATRIPVSRTYRESVRAAFTAPR